MNIVSGAKAAIFPPWGNNHDDNKPTVQNSGVER